MATIRNKYYLAVCRYARVYGLDYPHKTDCPQYCDDICVRDNRECDWTEYVHIDLYRKLLQENKQLKEKGER